MFTCMTGKNEKWPLTLHNDLESKSCFLCETVISHGFITSSIVTAAMALMLVETVLWTKSRLFMPFVVVINTSLKILILSTTLKFHCRHKLEKDPGSLDDSGKCPKRSMACTVKIKRFFFCSKFNSD